MNLNQPKPSTGLGQDHVFGMNKYQSSVDISGMQHPWILIIHLHKPRNLHFRTRDKNYSKMDVRTSAHSTINCTYYVFMHIMLLCILCFYAYYFFMHIMHYAHCACIDALVCDNGIFLQYFHEFSRRVTIQITTII